MSKLSENWRGLKGDSPPFEFKLTLKSHPKFRRLHFDFGQIEKYHPCVQSDFLVCLVSQLGRANNRSILLEDKIQEKEAEILGWYNKVNNETKNYENLLLHRAILDQFGERNFDIIGDWKSLLKILEFYWAARIKGEI